MLHYHTHLWSLPRGVYVLALAGMLLAAQVPLACAAQPSLERDVLPILTKNCMGCHGGLKQEGGLDLRTVPTMLKGGESGPAIKSGHADESELWRRIEADEMPEGETKLSADDKATIRAWIAAGLPTIATLQKPEDPILSPGKKHEPREVAAAIDRHIQAALGAQGLKPAPRSDDAEFLRRIYLDLTGRVPTAEQAAAFLDNSDQDKRARLIDDLLSKPEFGEQLGRTWRDWISPPELPSDANGGKQPHKEAQNFGRWLGERFTTGDAWDQIVRDILTVEGEIKNQPQVIFFGLVGQDGKETADGSMRAVASLFMGVQLQCAQCHDDPYRDWSQQEHWALASFFEGMDGDFNKITEKKDHKSAEIAIPKTAFKNVGQMVPASFLRSESPLPQGQAAQRRQLVEWLTSQDNPYFDQAFANRLWFYFFSRGIVMPVDDFRELNPPSHPGLMELLASEFAASQFDVKHLVRCITNSETYQATSRIARGAESRRNARANESLWPRAAAPHDRGHALRLAETGLRRSQARLAGDRSQRRQRQR
jgi:hypothetical protein